ncbi:MAG: sigma-70 family RNA polymerase sigma factor [Pseudomonadota bacterium]
MKTTAREQPVASLDAAIQRARTGDADAFADIYRAFSRRVLGLCRKLLGSGAAAEDASSEVFVRTQRAMDSYDPAQPFDRWILTITSNHCLNQLRRQKLERHLFATEPEVCVADRDPGPSPLAQLQSHEEHERLRRAIEELPERYRIPLVLRYYGELSYDEIATELEITRDNVAILLHRAKRSLREAMRATGEGKP